MGSIPNVVRRGTIYHFRRAVPLALCPRLRRCELLRSLQTSKPLTARARTSELYAMSEILFAAASAPTMLSEEQLARLVQDFYRTVLDRENEARLQAGFITDEIRLKRQAYYAELASRSRDALACNRLDEGAFVTEAMLKKQGLAPGQLGRLELAQAKEAVLRAGIDLADSLAARYRGRLHHEPADRLAGSKWQLRLPQRTWCPHRPIRRVAALPVRIVISSKRRARTGRLYPNYTPTSPKIRSAQENGNGRPRLRPGHPSGSSSTFG